MTVETAVPVDALFTDTAYDDTAIQSEVDLNTEKRTYPVSDETKLGTIEDDAKDDQTGSEIISLTSDLAESMTNKTLTDPSNTIYADRVEFDVLNTTGTTITKGTPVTITEYSTGTEIVVTDQATMIASGIVVDDILHTGTGQIVSVGILEGVDTENYAEGIMLYVNGGVLTDTEPTTGFSQPIAVVLRDHITDGVLQVLAAYPKQDADDVRYDGTTSVKTAIDGKDSYPDQATHSGKYLSTDGSITSWNEIVSEEYVDAADALKADQTTTYTKIETDAKIADVVAGATATTIDPIAAAIIFG